MQIFCVHGGIPSNKSSKGLISEIENIPVDLPDPEKQSSLAWDLMWSDPLRYLTFSLAFIVIHFNSFSLLNLEQTH